MTNLVLLEPYRSAFFAEGYDTGLVEIVGGNKSVHAQMNNVGLDKELQRFVREIALFYDSVQIVHHEGQDTAQELFQQTGEPVLSARGLIDGGYFVPTNGVCDKDRLESIKTATSLDQFWALQRSELETWGALIASQITARGKLPHPGFFYIFMYHRLNDQEQLEEAVSELPSEYATGVESFIRTADESLFDIVVFSTLNELLEVDTTIGSQACHVAIDESFGGDCIAVNTDSPPPLHAVLIEELLDQELRLPTAENMIELKRLQNDEALASFREVFQRWLRSISDLDPKEELKLRREVRRAIRQFRHTDRISAAQKMCTFASISTSFYSAHGGAIFGFASLGLQSLAERWREESAWVNICPKALPVRTSGRSE